jgi:mono/diheme cytochrome c family protein
VRVRSQRLLLAGANFIFVTGTVGATAQQATSPPAPSSLDVRVLFAANCGFCHSDGGRSAGKGPQLMDTKRSDEFIRDRIKNGKEGAMPAFGQMFSDADIAAIVSYIHNLKPEGQG